ncbi:hypothetical protein SKAU_G00002860 [Synaphobranchus kaupii]|uniref:Uncharacterized protein n=1 Tax=Synaphobranchus kaupii TaxID=118154 RepID=A0A9Q1G9G3_SYNKA|nr:hypothetical protein SKAU_G00002860 [Synaphobranchus kaupii]
MGIRKQIQKLAFDTPHSAAPQARQATKHRFHINAADLWGSSITPPPPNPTPWNPSTTAPAPTLSHTPRVRIINTVPARYRQPRHNPPDSAGESRALSIGRFPPLDLWTEPVQPGVGGGEERGSILCGRGQRTIVIPMSRQSTMGAPDHREAACVWGDASSILASLSPGQLSTWRVRRVRQSIVNTESGSKRHTDKLVLIQRSVLSIFPSNFYDPPALLDGQSAVGTREKYGLPPVRSPDPDRPPDRALDIQVYLQSWQGTGLELN